MIIPDGILRPSKLDAGLYFIGLGLGEIDSLPLRALHVLKQCNKILIDGYTNFFTKNIVKDLHSLCQTPVEVINRQQLEDDAIEVVTEAKKSHIALLVSGDPFLATTHTTIRNLAVEEKVPFSVIHNASIFSVAISKSGLSSYKFGKTPTIPFPSEVRSNYPYNVIKHNQSIGCHTLVLLDIEVKEEKFLDISTAIQELLAVEAEKKEKVIIGTTLTIGMAKLGSSYETVQAGTLHHVQNLPWKTYGPPQCFIICDSDALHFAEIESLNALFNLQLSTK